MPETIKSIINKIICIEKLTAAPLAGVNLNKEEEEEVAEAKEIKNKTEELQSLTL